MAVWPTRAEVLVALFAALSRLGVVLCPLNGQWGRRRRRRCFSSDPPSAWSIKPRAKAGAAMACGSSHWPSWGSTDLAGDAISQPDDDIEVAVSESDPHVVFYTSGSSGTPKGAVLRIGNLLRSLPGALLEPRGAMVCPYPLFHMGAWTIALQQWAGRAMLSCSCAQPGGRDRGSGGAPPGHPPQLRPPVWRRLLQRTSAPGAPICRPSASRTPAPRPTPPSSSRPSPRRSLARGGACHLRFDGGRRRHRPRARRPGGQAGQLRCPGPAHQAAGRPERPPVGPWPLLFDGYSRRSAATQGVLADGWSDTGDLADVDDDGYVSIVGRAGDVIRTGGEAVVPAEVEAVLQDYPGVADVAVVGLPDPAWGEVVCAAVVVSAPGEAFPTLPSCEPCARAGWPPTSIRATWRSSPTFLAPRPPGRSSGDSSSSGLPPPGTPAARAGKSSRGCKTAFSDRRIIGAEQRGDRGGDVEREVLLTGIGGQGIQLAAQVLAEAALEEGRDVQLFGAYGGMMRGGSTEATLVVSDGPVQAPPTVGSAWAALVLHHRVPPSLCCSGSGRAGWCWSTRACGPVRPTGRRRGRRGAGHRSGRRGRQRAHRRHGDARRPRCGHRPGVARRTGPSGDPMRAALSASARRGERVGAGCRCPIAVPTAAVAAWPVHSRATRPAR